MKDPLSSVCRDSFLRLRFLASVRPYLSKSTCLKQARLVTALITSRLDHCNSDIGVSNIPFKTCLWNTAALNWPEYLHEEKNNLKQNDCSRTRSKHTHTPTPTHPPNHPHTHTHTHREVQTNACLFWHGHTQYANFRGNLLCQATKPHLNNR